MRCMEKPAFQLLGVDAPFLLFINDPRVETRGYYCLTLSELWFFDINLIYGL